MIVTFALTACYAEGIPEATEQEAKGKPSAQVRSLLIAEGIRPKNKFSGFRRAGERLCPCAYVTRIGASGQHRPANESYSGTRVPGATP